jgi:hypothetical protein
MCLLEFIKMAQNRRVTLVGELNRKKRMTVDKTITIKESLGFGPDPSVTGGEQSNYVNRNQ